MIKVNRRVALVTGASRGIGRGIALELARQGVRVAVNYYSHPDAAQAVVREIEKEGGQAVAVGGDVSREQDVAAMFSVVHSKLGFVEILVNNAAVGDPGYIDTTKVDESTWDHLMSVNLKGPFLTCRSALPHMAEAGWGRIVNISSTSGITGGTSGTHYAAAKGGMIPFSLALAKEWAHRGITVNVVAPSKVDTDLFREVTPEDRRPEVIKKIPVGRLGTSEDVARAVLFFTDEQADFVTGQVLVVSGGY
ncbi:MAG TPA: 3-oxoacyl-ACP reductase family protein [Atribacteraceae bacterium]|nr:3-oxoacyl-ACP reductase family protein [Atribacteraceae bacterium]